MSKFKFGSQDLEQVKRALGKVENSTLNEISAELIQGATIFQKCCNCDWSKSRHSKSGDA